MKFGPPHARLASVRTGRDLRVKRAEFGLGLINWNCAMPGEEYRKVAVLNEKGETFFIGPKEWLPMSESVRAAWDTMSAEDRQVIIGRAIYGTAAKLAFPELGVDENSDYDEITETLKRARPEWPEDAFALWPQGPTVMNLLLSEIGQHIPEDISKGSILEQLFWQLAEYQRAAGRRQKRFRTTAVGRPPCITRKKIKTAVRELRKAKQRPSQRAVAQSLGLTDRALRMWQERNGYASWGEVLKGIYRRK